ncbi:hypothetical protein BJY24_001185 [Nocardia transvalensis]|uniref:Secreted protein n=1 Tax=Nocardia transvalensis TaxID=37333 RepID=A0A7W9UGI9_9NOCA|nr:hypothetical protein [Nocardia transvalensis]MBB5912318.1 hypothetical protein [Nocardia transvalensis]
MRKRQFVLRSALAVAAVGGVIATVAPAAVAAGPRADLGDIHTLGDICYGRGWVSGSADDAQPGATQFWVTFTRWTPTFGNQCGVTVIVQWRNLDTGAEGTVPVPVADTGTATNANRPVLVSATTGSGRVSFTASTDRPHLPPATVELQVP